MNKRIFTLSDFDFHLPEELIAQYPSPERDRSRLFVIDKDGEFHHKRFCDIIEFLREGDVMVMNNARVIPARVLLRRESGGRVEFVLTQKLNEISWLAITNRTSRLKIGEKLIAERDSSIFFEIEGRQENFFRIRSSVPLSEQILEKIGSIPLPPYISRPEMELDKDRYQTVYAEKSCAVAAPTAGLHFTKELLDKCKQKGVICVNITLEVSWGTFSPVRCENLSLHRMHEERFSFPTESASLINEARANNRRIIAIGTTSLRVLEATYRNGKNIAREGTTDIFIRPPYDVYSADCLLTNFHTPRSTLLMLVCAFGGYERIMRAYEIAVNLKYRFFSYGDAMFIEKK
ncbi:MAG: tRNA preQ1(34) S-adenosylmethionine ribosyltransferase-isomerase QueA [Spirochaetes bacterium]|nr:tRNA preQ1(34) S-adenosylmethionine ribosyltransferase-isomerase QueA [Spirochaetota bacterium]